ncbi:MAG: hypothetical protein ABI844_18780 [Saprospiraceae bacterium]
MEKLDSKYINTLEEIKSRIQSSDTLAALLEDESEASFQALRDEFEPEINTIYHEVGTYKPLQILDLEQIIMDGGFEGVYLPKILGYTVLRGDVDEYGKYRRPQDQFGLAVKAIANCNNFELLKNKTGQTLQIGFSLSSDIWVSNLVEHLENKRSRVFFESIRSQQIHDDEARKSALAKYGRQFEGAPYHSAEFPNSQEDLKSLYIPLKDFLLHRVKHFTDNSSLLPYLSNFLKNERLYHLSEYWNLVYIIANFYPMEGADQIVLQNLVNENRRNDNTFSEQYFRFLHQMHKEDIVFNAEVDKNVEGILDENIHDDVKRYYELADVIHSKGYMHEDTIEAVRNFYESNEGLSVINATVRNTILGYFKTLLNNLDEGEYQNYFEISKIFHIYMKIFSNEKFNQDVQSLNQKFVHKLLSKYNDKRGKDYQEIKKFVTSNFAELDYMKEKDITELFKTKRKKASV